MASNRGKVESGMSDKNTPNPVQVPAQQVKVECPHCKTKFWHKLGEKIKEAAESAGEAIGEAKFGE